MCAVKLETRSFNIAQRKVQGRFVKSVQYNHSLTFLFGPIHSLLFSVIMFPPMFYYLILINYNSFLFEKKRVCHITKRDYLVVNDESNVIFPSFMPCPYGHWRTSQWSSHHHLGLSMPWLVAPFYPSHLGSQWPQNWWKVHCRFVGMIPPIPNTLENVLVSTFQGGGKQTKTGGNEVPRTTFLLTVNFKLDDDLRFAILFVTLCHKSTVLLPVLGDRLCLRFHSSLKQYSWITFTSMYLLNLVKLCILRYYQSQPH